MVAYRSETPTSAVETAFNDFTERPDIAILLINQHVRLPGHPSVYNHLIVLSLQIADKIRPLLEQYTQAFPAVLEIPSKDHPYG
jgi:V-type H+-transporting ATPase subunit F